MLVPNTCVNFHCSQTTFHCYSKPMLELKPDAVRLTSCSSQQTTKHQSHFHYCKTPGTEGLYYPSHGCTLPKFLDLLGVKKSLPVWI